MHARRPHNLSIYVKHPYSTYKKEKSLHGNCVWRNISILFFKWTSTYEVYRSLIAFRLCIHQLYLSCNGKAWTLRFTGSVQHK